ncbi:MAG TPA: cation-translocating P-type ATPase [Anaerolineae bacterium]|nr:cation-translocating P-type ATPase [Anaerolineae bacterium]HPL28413.1 cation-translocating P-type ATPase [Anaerolineae bacterium]
MEEERWHAVSVEAALQSAQVNPNHGLSSAEARRRLDEIGYNELAVVQGPSPLQLFVGQFNDFIVWVLLAAAIVSGPVLGEWTDAIAITVIVILNGLLGFVQEYRAGKALEALRQLTAPTATVVRDGRPHEIPAREVAQGDILIIETGDLVAADGRLVETRNLSIDQAVLTGESAPVAKEAETTAPADAPLADRDNMVYSSTVATRGRGRALVVATGPRTELGKIARMVQEIAPEATPLQQQLDRVGHYLVYAALFIVAIIFVLDAARGEPLLQVFLVAVSLAVAAIPEGLPAVVTIALAIGVRRMAARNALVRRLRSVETLGSASVICTDKTGTLTQNQMTVRQLVTPERTIQVSGEGYAPLGSFASDGEAIAPDAADVQAVVRVAILASTADLVQEDGTWRIRGDPTEGSLITVAAKAGYDEADAEAEYEFLEELPFDSERKRMSVVYTFRGDGQGPAGLSAAVPSGGRVAFVKGAPEAILPLCVQVQEAGQVKPLAPHERREFLDVNSFLGGQALRVLAMAYRPLPVEVPLNPDAVERDLVLVGMAAMIDPPRPEARDAVRTSQEAGLTVVMITGDQPNTAIAIAREIGIFREDDVSLTGAELEQISDERLDEIVNRVRVYARVAPEHKLRIVRAWRSQHQIVGMTGDGVNDAPALKEADIGISMGVTGTDVAKEASDMILADDNFATIVSATAEGRTIFDNIRRFVQFMLSANTGEVLTLFIAGLIGLPLPLIPIQILWINLATDSLPALALGVETAEPGIMQRPPRAQGEGILTRAMAFSIGWQGALIGFVTLGAFALELFARGGGVERARVLAFSTSILAQALHAYNLRSLRYSLFTIGPFTNRFMNLAFIIVILANLAIIYVPFLQPIFATMPLDLPDWAIVVGLGFAPLLIVQATRVIGEMRAAPARPSP